MLPTPLLFRAKHGAQDRQSQQDNGQLAHTLTSALW